MPIAVTTSGVVHSASVSITETLPSTIVEGTAVILEATSHSGFTDLTPAPAGTVWDNTAHEITHIWTVRGSPLSAYDYVSNMVTGWDDPNVAYGKRVAFHFPDAGSYVVDLWCVGPNGETAIANTSTITVQAFGDVFTGTNVVCYSNDGSETWADEVSGCTRATTFSQIVSATASASGPVAVLFKSGQTATPSNSNRILINGASERVEYVGKWGGASKAIIQMWDSADDNFGANGLFYFAGATNGTSFLNFRDLRVQGTWEPDTVTGKAGQSPIYMRDHSVQDTLTCVSNCEFDGLFGLTLSTDTAVRQQMVMANCQITNWQDYGTYAVHNGSSDFHMIGCDIAHNVNAINATDWGKNNLGPRHGPLRLPDVGYFTARSCRFFSRTGWSGIGSDFADQACLRLFSNGNPNNSYSYLDRIVCEGGSQQIAYAAHDTSLSENDGNHIADKVLMISTAKSYECFIRADFGGLTVRNAYGILQNVPDWFSGNGWQGAILHWSNASSPSSNANGPMRFYGNTFVNQRNAANDNGDSWPVRQTVTTAFNNVTEENNILYAPSIDTPVTSPDSTMDTASNIAGVTAVYGGVKVFPSEFQGEASGLGSLASGNSMTFSYPSGTDQTYWQARLAGDNKDVINDGTAEGSSKYYAEDGDFTISFDASVITITNTSGSTWTSASRQLLLDYGSNTSALALDATYANTSTLTLVQPDTGSSALNPGTGLFPYDDFSNPGSSTQKRGSNPDAGAIQVSA